MAENDRATGVSSPWNKWTYSPPIRLSHPARCQQIWYVGYGSWRTRCPAQGNCDCYMICSQATSCIPKRMLNFTGWWFSNPANQLRTGYLMYLRGFVYARFFAGLLTSTKYDDFGIFCASILLRQSDNPGNFSNPGREMHSKNDPFSEGWSNPSPCLTDPNLNEPLYNDFLFF